MPTPDSYDVGRGGDRFDSSRHCTGEHLRLLLQDQGEAAKSLRILRSSIKLRRNEAAWPRSRSPTALKHEAALPANFLGPWLSGCHELLVHFWDVTEHDVSCLQGLSHDVVGPGDNKIDSAKSGQPRYFSLSDSCLYERAPGESEALAWQGGCSGC